MALTGSLSDLSLPDIVQTIAFNKKSGILSIKSEVGIGQIYFFDGNVIQAISPLRRERLGENLMKKGIITRQQLEAALKIQEERGHNQRLGSTLLEMDLISKELNEASLRQQTEEAFYDLIEWSIGFFRFDPKPNFKNLGIALDPYKLLLEGTRRQDESKKGVYDKTTAEIVSKLISIYGKDLDNVLKDLEIIAVRNETKLEENVDLSDSDGAEPLVSIKNILNEFQNIEHVKLVLIVGKNGSFHDCAGEPDDIHFTLSAMAGSSWGLLETLAAQINPDDQFKQSFIQFAGSSIFVKSITDDWMLLIATGTEVSVRSLMTTFLTFRKQMILAMSQMESL